MIIDEFTITGIHITINMILELNRIISINFLFRTNFHIIILIIFCNINIILILHIFIMENNFI